MLGDELSTALTNLTKLIIREKNPDNLKLLMDQQERLAGELQVFIDRVVDQTLPEYAEATTALETANKLAEAAKADLDKVAATITAVARAADKVSVLAVKVGV
jgi:hypothetical protein